MERVEKTLGLLVASIEGPVSEDDQLELLDTLGHYLKQIPQEYISEGRNVHSYAIFVLLSVASSADHPVPNKIAALEALSILTSRLKGVSLPSAFARSFLPGVCSKLVKVILAKGGRQPHTLLILSLKILFETLMLAGSSKEAPLDGKSESNINGLFCALSRACRHYVGVPSVAKAFREFALDASRYFYLSNETHYSPLFELLSFLHANSSDTSGLDAAAFHRPLINDMFRAQVENLDRLHGLSDETKKNQIELLSFLFLACDRGIRQECLPAILERLDVLRQKAKRAPLSASLIISRPECVSEPERTVEACRFFVTTVAKSGEFLSLFDYYLAARPGNLDSRTESLLMLSLAVSSLDREVAFEHSRIVVDQVLSLVDVCFEDTDVDGECLSKVNECLARSLNMIVPCLSPQRALNLVPFIISPMVCALADPDPAVCSLAEQAFKSVSRTCGLAPDKLVATNVDYIIDRLSMQLRAPNLYPFAPKILAGVLRIAGPNAINFISDVLDQVLEHLECLQMPPRFVFSLLECLDACLKFGSRCIGACHENIEDDNDANIVLTREQEIASKIINVSVHFVSHDKRRIRMLALEILGNAATLFHPYARRTFLPLAHLMWPFVLARVAEPDSDVSICALDTVSSITKVAGDFMRERINEEFWPVVKRLFGQPSAYQIAHSTLLSRVLSTLVAVLEFVNLKDKVTSELLKLLYPLYHDEVATQLGLAAMDLSRLLIKKDSDQMWFFLKVQLGADTVFDPPSPLLSRIDSSKFRLIPASQYHHYKSRIVQLQSLV